MSLTIDAATPADLLELERLITPADAAELAAAGLSVREGVGNATAQALRYREQLVCLFGAELVPGHPGVGVPWMLCTSTLHDVPRRAMAQVSADVVDSWRADFKRLMNLVHRHNEQAIRFVQWLGFTVFDEPAGPGGEFFVFEWRDDV